MNATGRLALPKLSGTEIKPNVWLLNEPSPVPGTSLLRALANVHGQLAVVELSLKFPASEVATCDQ